MRFVVVNKLGIDDDTMPNTCSESVSTRTATIAWLLALALWGCQSAETQNNEAREAARVNAAKGKALFEEKCRTVAGERIYHVVADVEGIVLLNVRPQRGDRELSDPMWSGAAFARESFGDEYIKTFLGYEYPPGNGLSGTQAEITPESRGYIATDRRPNGRPGYRYVLVMDDEDQQTYRYVLAEKSRPTSRIGWVDTVLRRSVASAEMPRYGITFEDIVVPEERALGVAASKVKVLDLRTKEVLGELVRYAWSPFAPSPSNPTPWLTAYRCPDHAIGTNAATRKFVDQVLIPRPDGSP